MPAAKPYIDCETRGHVKVPAALAKLATEAYYLDEEIKDLTKQLKTKKEKLKADIGDDAILVLPGVGTVPVVSRITPVVEDYELLRGVLESRFDDMVVTNESYKPGDSLLAVIDDEDHELHEVVMECVDFKESTAISFKREK